LSSFGGILGIEEVVYVGQGNGIRWAGIMDKEHEKG